MDDGFGLDKDVLERTPPEVIELLHQMAARMAALEAEAAKLREQVERSSANSSLPPSSDRPDKQRKRKPPQKPSGRKRGGQKGHPKHSRPLVEPDKVDKVVACKPDECHHCGSSLDGDDQAPIRHQVAEIPPITPHITEYQIHKLNCDICGETTRGQLPADVPAGSFGPRLTAILALLSGGCRLGKRTIRQLVEQLFGLKISLGMICKLERLTACALAEPVAELAEAIRSENVNIDETSWRENKRRCWLWAVVAPLLTLFKIAARRNAEVAKELLGDEYKKVATSDRHGAYNWVWHRQICWSHLRRDFQAMIDRGGPGQPIGEELLSISDALFEWWHRVCDGTLARSSFRKYVGFLRNELIGNLEKGLECGCAKTKRICKRMLKEEKYFWTFARIKGVEPTNNEGERTINVAVRWRKMSAGTDSEAGSRFVERILSVSATCRQQGRDLLDYLTATLTAHFAGSPSPSLLPTDPQ